MTKKICSKCDEKKDITDFYKYARKTPKGFGLKEICKSCYLKKIKEDRKNNPKKYAKNNKRYRSNVGIHYTWAMGSIASHRKKGIKINFTIKELANFVKNKIDCCLCGKKLSWGNNVKIKDSSPSMDNINCKDEITFNDIQIICYDCNRTKGKRTMKNFVSYCENIASLHQTGISRFSKERDLLKGNTDIPEGAML